MLKVLFIAWYFPPSNTIAAVRLGKLAKFLCKAGHDIRILTAANVPYAQTLPVEIPSEWILRTSWIDINNASSCVKSFLHRILGRAPKTRIRAPSDAEPANPTGRISSYGGKASKYFQLVFNFPDKQ